MFMAIVQSVQRLIVDNTRTLEFVLTFRGQLKTVTPTNRSSKALPRCQHMRLPSLVPTGVLCSTRRHESSSNLRGTQACIIVNATVFAGKYHRQLYNVYKHCIIVISAMFAGIHRRRLYNVYKHCIIVNSTMFTSIISSSTLQCLQSLYRRQIYNV